MYGGRRAGDDRGVVGVGEGGDHGIGDGEKAAFAKRGDGRQDAIGDAALDVARVAAVETDHHRRPLRDAVAPPIHAHLCHRINPRCVSSTANALVIPGLVPGIQPSTNAGAI